MGSSQSIEKLKAKQERLAERIKLLKSREKERKKKQDTRKKILLGAYLLERMAKDESLEKETLVALEKFLTRKTDRELFEMAPKQKEKGQAWPAKLPEKKKASATSKAT